VVIHSGKMTPSASFKSRLEDVKEELKVCGPYHLHPLWGCWY